MSGGSLHTRRLAHNLSVVFAGVFLLFLFIKGGALEPILTWARNYSPLASFFGGLFFTSLLTTGPAVVFLGSIGQTAPLWQTVFFGGIGAVIGDLLLFRLVRDTFSEDISYIVSKQKHTRIFHLLHTKFMRHLWPLMGGLIIASPLPDELGITLLGVSRLRTEKFIPISLLFNMIGITLVVLVGRLL